MPNRLLEQCSPTNSRICSRQCSHTILLTQTLTEMSPNSNLKLGLTIVTLWATFASLRSLLQVRFHLTNQSSEMMPGIFPTARDPAARDSILPPRILPCGQGFSPAARDPSYSQRLSPAARNPSWSQSFTPAAKDPAYCRGFSLATRDPPSGQGCALHADAKT